MLNTYIEEIQEFESKTDLHKHYETELETIINDTVKELNATSIKEMGIVIKTISSKVGNRADMSIVSKKVKEILNK